MRACYLSGERSAALAQYEYCHQLLMAHLNIEPDQETQELYHAIRDHTVQYHMLGASIPAVQVEESLAESLAIENPYKGLRAFRETEAADFFGRERLIQELLSRLSEPGQQAHFLAVVGPSGCGKTSVVRAGLVPALHRSALAAGYRQSIRVLLPGSRPFQRLAVALCDRNQTQVAPIAQLLAQHDDGLIQAIELLYPLDTRAELILVIDQFEEIFTLMSDEQARSRLLKNLMTAVEAPGARLRLIITLRADFYDRPLSYPGFAELLSQRTIMVMPLTSEELLRAIVRPAQRVGVDISDELLAALLHDVGNHPGALPFLQFALTEVFSRREGRQLSLEAYTISGGVKAALVNRADNLFMHFNSMCQAAARQLFLRLITLGEGTEDTRRRVRHTELLSVYSASDDPESQCMQHVIERYGHYRLLSFDSDPMTHEPTVEIAHEALLQRWERLQHWLESSRMAVRVHRRLSDATVDWLQAGQEASFLVSGVRLDEFEALERGQQITLNRDELTYLHTSQKRRDQQNSEEQLRRDRELTLAQQSVLAQRSAAQRLRWLVLILALFLLVAMSLSGFALNQRRAAEANFTRSEAQRLAAEANALAQRGADPELIALLSIRSLQTQHTPQGEAAIDIATTLSYPEKIFSGHEDEITSIAISPDGHTALSASHDKTIVLWAIETDQALHVFRGHTDSVMSIAWSPDGRSFVSGSSDRTARVWDAQTGRLIRILSGHAGAIMTIAFSPDGQLIASAGMDRTIRLWDAYTGTPLRIFEGHQDAISSLAFAPDGQFLLTGSYDRTARLWNIDTGQSMLVLSGHTDKVTCVAFSARGTLIVTGSADSTARLWERSNGAELRRYTGHTGSVTSLVVGTADQSILTASADSSIRIWTTTTGAIQRTIIGPGEGITSIAFAPDGQSILAASATSMRLWTVASNSMTPILQGHTGPVNSVAFAPHGHTVLTGSADGTAQLWDTQSGTALGSLSGHKGPVLSVALASHGQHILTGSADQSVRLWDLQSQKQLSSFPLGAEVKFVAFMPGDQQALVCDSNGSVWILDLQHGQQSQHLTDGMAGICSAVYQPEHGIILSADQYTSIRSWNIVSGKQERLLNLRTESQNFMIDQAGHATIVVNRNPAAASLSFSNDGQHILTGNYDTTARLWDSTTGRLLKTFMGHNNSILSTAIASDQQHVLTGSADTTARIWDVTTGQEERYLSGHTGRVLAVAFSPDQQRTITGSSDGTARLWFRDYDAALQALCAHLQRDFSAQERVEFSIADQVPTCPVK